MDYKLRQKKLADAMKAQGIDTCIISIPVNLYYLCGRIFDGYFCMDSDANGYYFMRRGAHIDGKTCYTIRKPEQIREIFADMGASIPKTVMLEDDYINAATYERLSKVFDGAAIKRDIIRSVRSVKTDWEVAQMVLSAQAHADMYRQIPSVFRHGMTDVEFSIELEHLSRTHGNLGLFRVFGTNMEIYVGSVLAGDNGGETSPYDFALGGLGVHPSCPIGANGTKLTDGISVAVDINGNFTGYISDMTRTFSVGNLPPDAYDAHQMSRYVQDEIAHLAKPGAVCGELYEKAIAIIKASKYWDCYMENKQGSRFVGHGLGLEINEAPVLFGGSNHVLEENMCFALEPKFIIGGVGPVGVENTYVMRKNGCEKLTVCEEEIVRLG